MITHTCDRCKERFQVSRVVKTREAGDYPTAPTVADYCPFCGAERRECSTCDTIAFAPPTEGAWYCSITCALAYPVIAV